MKMIPVFLCLLFIGASYATAQTSQDDALVFNDRKNVVHGVYLGLTTHYGEIEGRPTYLGGVKVAYVANRQFEVGFAGTFVYSDQDLVGQDLFQGEDLIGGYGGLHLEPIFFGTSAVSLSFPVLIGAGGITYVDGNFSTGFGYRREANAFFLVEPGANLLFNISRYLQLEAGVKYRFTGDIDLEPDSITDLDGFSVGLGIKVGVFNLGRNRYKTRG